MTWFDDLKRALPKWYAPANTDIVGYLRGSDDPAIWLQMERSNRPQMMILGSAPPTPKDWNDAGVGARGMDCTIRLARLQAPAPGAARGFIVLYGGGTPRPWGKIYALDDEALQHFPGQLETWKRNAR